MIDIIIYVEVPPYEKIKKAQSNVNKDVPEKRQKKCHDLTEGHEDQEDTDSSVPTRQR